MKHKVTGEDYRARGRRETSQPAGDIVGLTSQDEDIDASKTWEGKRKTDVKLLMTPGSCNSFGG